MRKEETRRKIEKRKIKRYKLKTTGIRQAFQERLDEELHNMREGKSNGKHLEKIQKAAQKYNYRKHIGVEEFKKKFQVKRKRNKPNY